MKKEHVLQIYFLHDEVKFNWTLN